MFACTTIGTSRNSKKIVQIKKPSAFGWLMNSAAPANLVRVGILISSVVKAFPSCSFVSFAVSGYRPTAKYPPGCTTPFPYTAPGMYACAPISHPLP